MFGQYDQKARIYFSKIVTLQLFYQNLVNCMNYRHDGDKKQAGENNGAERSQFISSKWFILSHYQYKQAHNCQTGEINSLNT